MKKHSYILFTQMTPARLENLTTLVKETLANGFNAPKAKIFTATDLWSIRRQGKSRSQRRFSY